VDIFNIKLSVLLCISITIFFSTKKERKVKANPYLPQKRIV